MKTFLLFLYGTFEDHEDIEYFCLEVIGGCRAVKAVRYVVENDKNIIIIFESDLQRKELSENLHSVMTNDVVKFYFLFERDSIYSANLPVQMKDSIFKPFDEHTSLRVEYEKTTTSENRVTTSGLDLDVILEKIEQSGIESLTEDEKKFLDNFEN